MPQQRPHEQPTEQTTTDRTPVVHIDSVSKYYGDDVAAEDVSISVSNGEFLTMLGPSGAGKTTLLHMIAGFETPTDGEIYTNGEPVSHKAPYERNIGLVFQDLALFPNMTVEENIAYPLKMRRLPGDEIDEKVSDVLELVRLPAEYAPKPVDELSGGQQQRVAIARAIVFEPALLLLDEPLSSLDKKLREEMRAELSRIHNETDLTIIHVTHNQTQALSMADRIAVLNGGELEQLAPAKELYSDPASTFVADFIGDTTLFEGTVTELNETGTVVDQGGIEVAFDPPDGIELGSEVTVGVRAEHVSIDAQEGATIDNGSRNVYNATVESVSFEGDRTKYQVSLDGSEITMQITAPNSTETEIHAVESDVSISWVVADMLVYPES
ncbi:ABC transporter ATP-binding protein [Halostagnicola sp. A-GB9-2]|uniref:ABC transporter ATP-binding protein n=1 Tax=Halostagnicola sp. A-GB9-2 TaxID=3048066 RepID=UPI0024C028AF|nr:ABC transporter ATP-binding protein [Halostagnicola sp. A-GB9-2]MDJ1434209.1 ABC transporter ATP-binding protein [Halostagnicola sp. A-GB9-2]